MFQALSLRTHGGHAALWAVVIAALTASVVGETTTVDITVPDSVTVRGQDAYICTTVELPNKPYKLVGVEALAKQEVVHHILLFGCDVPYSKPKPGEQSAWECVGKPACGDPSETILYGWGRNADRLDLPPGVGFSVGRGSAVKWIVAQVHYLDPKPAADKSGVRLKLQDTPVPFSGGLLSYASWFSIPPGKPHFLVQDPCCYRGFQPLTTFAVRVHTHALGQRVSMTRAPASGSGHGEIIAAGDPQKPQGFYPVTPNVLWPGERLNVVCDFDSTGNTVIVGAGPSHEHEMCNMYLMVYSAIPHIEMCSGGNSVVDETTPGNLPRAAALLPDPYPLWKPPEPTDATDKGMFGNVASVALGPDGTLWALHRGGRVWGPGAFDANERITDQEPIAVDVVVQMHPDTGKVLRKWGAGHFWMPHMITIDRNNSVWVADVGRHQVLKFTASGQLLMTVGRKLQPGHDKLTLCKPTQAAFMNDGSFLVSDGYCNSRVMRFNPDGSYHSQYELPKGSSFIGVAHSLVLDECDGEVLLADREGMMVHKWDLNTRQLIETISLAQYGKVWALVKGPYGRTLALTWQPGSWAVLLDVSQPVFHWRLPNSSSLWPHDLALGPAALPLTGAGDRLLAVYVAPLCKECGAIQKYVLFPQDFGAPRKDLPAPVVAPAARKPVLAHIHVGGQGAAAAAAAAHVQQQHHQEVPEGEQDEIKDMDEKTEREDEQAEEEVQKEEEQEDQAEVQQLANATVHERLSHGLETIQEELKADSDLRNAEYDSDEYKTMHSAGASADAGNRSWGSTLSVIVLSVLLGTVVGAFAVHTLHTNALSKPPFSRKGAQAATAANGHQQHDKQSINSMLRIDEDIEMLERDRLLSNGLHSGPDGLQNGSR